MKYELDFGLLSNEAQQLSPLLQPACELYLSGNPAKAFVLYREGRQALRVQRAAGELKVDDWHFVVTLLNSCSMFEHAGVVAREALHDFPADPNLKLAVAWDVAVKGKLFDCRDMLNELSQATPVIARQAKALHAYNYALSGWRKSAAEAMEEAKAKCNDDALGCYILSRAASFLSLWQEAIEFGERAVDLLPGWSRARATLADSLLAQGRAQEAHQLLQSLPVGSPKFFSCSLSVAHVLEVMRRTDEAIGTLQDLLRQWPIRSRYQRMAARQLAFLLLSERRDDEANQVLSEYRIRQFAVDPDKQDQPRKMIPLPLVSQAHNHCVPTSAAMVAEAQGVAADPLRFADGMMTQNGTPMWRMLDYMDSLGFTGVCVKPSLETVRYFIDHGVPLIGVLQTLFNSHVEVVCGYDLGLEIVHVRDPMHWFGRAFAESAISPRYETGGGLWALIRQSDIGLQVPAEYRESAGEALVNLARAVVKGERETAEEAYAQIPDDHVLAFSRDSYAQSVVLTTGECQRRMSALAKQEDSLQQLEGLRALMSQIDFENADRILELVRKQVERFGKQFVKFIECQCLVAKQEWKPAHELLTELTREIPQMEPMWRLLASVEEQLGNAEQADECLQRMLDISPDDLSNNRRVLEFQSEQIPFAERIERVSQLVSQNPDNTDRHWFLAENLADGEDGLAFERAMQDVCKFFPRHPGSHEWLADWYLYQGRTDLAIKTLEHGRNLIGEEELPLRDFEKPNIENEEIRAEAEDREISDVSPEAVVSAAAAHAPSAGQENRDETTQGTPLGFVGQFKNLIDECRELSSTETLKLQATVELLECDEKGELRWQHSVQLRSFLIQKNLEQPAESEDRITALVSELKSILPSDTIPGIPEHYALLLLRSLDHFPVSRVQAKIFLDWLERSCSDAGRYPRLEFEKAYLQERMGQLNEAEQTLDMIASRYPAFSASLYRKGQIASSRGDYQAAIDAYLRCLEAAPAIEGALTELVSLFEYLQDPRALEYRQKLVDLRPYSRSNIYDAAAATARAAGKFQPGLDYLEEHADRIRPQDRQLLSARLLADFQQHEQALTIVDSLTEVAEADQTIVDWIRVDGLVAAGSYTPAIEILERIVESSPGDSDAVDQLVRLYREVDPDKALEFARSELIEGSPHVMLAYVVCQQDRSPSQAAINIVGQVDPKHRDEVAAAFSQALSQSRSQDDLKIYLRWCNHKYPHMVDLREQLAFRLNMSNDHKEAMSVAKSLLDKDPENPRWLRLMGICAQDIQPRESITYLQRELEMTSSSETLVRLGRGYQILGESANAVKHYEDALSINEQETLAITNLVFKYKRYTRELFDCASVSIERGAGIEDQYFHVTAVLLARRLGLQLPDAWYPGALQRWELVVSGDAFHDEPLKLRSAIIAWAVKSKDEETLKKMSNLWRRLEATWWWPGTAWIPASAASRIKDPSR